MNLFIRYKFLFMISIMLVCACEFIKPKNDKIEIREGITMEQLQEERYTFKTEQAYKNHFVHQTKNDNVIVTIFNVIKYNIRDDEMMNSASEDFDYYIFDIGLDNPSTKPFNALAFTKSCMLTNENPSNQYASLNYVFNMYNLQTDSAQVDTTYLHRFMNNAMPGRDFIRAKMFAFEVMKEDKSALYFRYKIDNKDYAYKVRDAIE